MFPIINLGPLAIQSSGFLLLLSFFIGIWLIGRFSKNLGTNGDVIENSLLAGLLSGILGARIGFLLQNPAIFLDNPVTLISLTPSMLNPSFGILVGVIAMVIIAQKKHLPLWPTLDTLSPLIIFIFAGIHLANYANGNSFGLPTTLPWGIQLWNEIRHPVQIYALVMGLVLLIWLIFKTRTLNITGFLRSGVLILIVTASLGFITLFTRAFVARKILLGRFDLVQVSGLVVLALSLLGIFLRTYKPRKRIPVLLSLGSNHNPAANLSRALEALANNFRVRRTSSMYQTDPVKETHLNSHFLNQIVELETDLSYPELVSQLKSIEGKFGRVPGDRHVIPLDLDVLTYNGDVFTFRGKQIPDPDLKKFNYLTYPLAEMAPDFHHPASGQSIQNMTDNLEDDSTVLKLKEEVENGTEE